MLFISSLALTVTVTWLLYRMRTGTLLLDLPNNRGLHGSPVPRLGGIAIFASVWLLSPVWIQADIVSAIAGISLLLFVVSLRDDLKSLSASIRLVVHIGAAVLVVVLWATYQGTTFVSMRMSYAGFGALVGMLAVTLAIAWMTNLYNFMDGADGLAGGMSLLGFGGYAVACASQSPTLGHLAAVLAGGAAGFLVFNFPPAKIFMGDAGSIPMGFLAATLGFHGSIVDLWAWWFPLLVFSPFIVDASVTLFRRTVHGNKPWIAHRDHYYQRLILGGWTHRKTVLGYYAVMLAAGLSALAARQGNNPNAILLAWVIIYASLLLLLEWRLRGNNKSKNSDREAT